jgi:hypothetical protein
MNELSTFGAGISIRPAVDSLNVIIPNVYDVGFVYGSYLSAFPEDLSLNISANNVLFQFNYSITPGSVIPQFVIDSYPVSAFGLTGNNLGVVTTDILVNATYLDSSNNPL